MVPSKEALHQPAAAVLSVGTELTEGSIQDLHGRFLADALRASGMRTREIVLIPDDMEQFEADLDRLVRSTELVIITGGLGPTSDDLTREVVASVACVDLEFHQELWEEIEARFSGRIVARTNRKQAFIPAGFELIRNPYGTAPGFWGWIEPEPTERSLEQRSMPTHTLVVALPGPPRELRPLFRDSVQPMLTREFSLRKREELPFTVFLVSESIVEQLLQEGRTGTVEWGTRAEPFRIVVILRGGKAGEREALFSKIESRLGWLCARRGEAAAEGLVLDALKRRSLSLSVAESCTGGLVGKLLTDIPGASESFWGSLVVYSNDAKMRILEIPGDVIERYGAVSAATVKAMAVGAMNLSQAEVSCSISGIAGPSGGTADKPVGTVWIGVATKDGNPFARRFRFGGDRGMIRRKSAVAALLLCEATIVGKEVDNIELWQYI